MENQASSMTTSIFVNPILEDFQDKNKRSGLNKKNISLKYIASVTIPAMKGSEWEQFRWWLNYLQGYAMF